MVQVRDSGGMDWNGSIEVAKKYMDLRAHLGGKKKKKNQPCWWIRYGKGGWGRCHFPSLLKKKKI